MAGGLSQEKPPACVLMGLTNKGVHNPKCANMLSTPFILLPLVEAQFKFSHTTLYLSEVTAFVFPEKKASVVHTELSKADLQMEEHTAYGDSE